MGAICSQKTLWSTKKSKARAGLALTRQAARLIKIKRSTRVDQPNSRNPRHLSPNSNPERHAISSNQLRPQQIPNSISPAQAPRRTSQLSIPL
jgi:hypothetical protein